MYPKRKQFMFRYIEVDRIPYNYVIVYISILTLLFLYWSYIILVTQLKLFTLYLFFKWIIHIPKIYSFKMYDSVVFCVFIKLCNYHHYIIPEYFHHL